MNEIVEHQNDERQQLATRVDAALFRGDLSKLTDEERTVHMHRLCESVGLNPLTQPLAYITLNGRLVPYVKKDGTDQLRKIHGVNLEIVSRTVSGDLLTVHVRARDKTGRVDEDFGVVSIAGLRGEAAANAMMKAVTKGKRRATLSLCGLGFADESELDDIPNAFTREVPAWNDPAALRQAILDPRANLATAQAAERDAPKAEKPPIEEADPFEVKRTDDSAAAWSAWATQLLAHIKAASTPQRIDAWIIANSETLEELKHYDTSKFNKLRHMIQAAQDAKGKAQADDPR